MQRCVTVEERATLRCGADAAVADAAVADAAVAGAAPDGMPADGRLGADAATGDLAADGPAIAPSVDAGCGEGLLARFYQSPDFTGPPLVRGGQGLSFDWQEGGPAPGAKADYWSATFSGHLTPQIAGEHTFFVQADDGYRLWLDGELLLDRWSGALSHTLATTVRLERGRRYPLLLEFFEGVGSAKLDVSLQPPSAQPGPIPTCMLSEAPAAATSCPASLGACTPAGSPACSSGTGLRASYERLDGVASGKHIVASAPPSVDFEWLTGEARLSVPFRVTWEGSIEPPADDTYTFYLVSDGASSITVADQSATFEDVASEVRPEVMVNVRLLAGRKYPNPHRIHHTLGPSVVMAPAALEEPVHPQGHRPPLPPVPAVGQPAVKPRLSYSGSQGPPGGDGKRPESLSTISMHGGYRRWLGSGCT